MGTDISFAQTKKVHVSLKQLQCWESSLKYTLLGVNNGMETTGIVVLTHHLKLIEKKLCQTGHLNTEEHYNLAIPKMHIYVCKLWKLSVPNDEQEHLSFSSFAAHCQIIFHAEASKEGSGPI